LNDSGDVTRAAGPEGGRLTPGAPGAPDGDRLAEHWRAATESERTGDEIGALVARLLELRDLDEIIERSEVIVVGNQSPEFADALARCRADQIVIDLVRLPVYGSLLQADYRGICW